MNRRLEEKLISYAFGELSPEESAALQRDIEADPASAKKLSEYRDMRHDLGCLTETPQTQVSVEQMRDAILRQGLKQRPRFGPYGWAFGASLAAVLGLSFLLNRPGAEPAQSAAPSNQAPIMFAFDIPQTPLHHETELTDVVRAAKHEYSFGASPTAAKTPSTTLALASKPDPSYVVHESTLADSVPADAVAYNAQDSQPSTVDTQPSEEEPAAPEQSSQPAAPQDANSPGNAVELSGPEDQTIVILKDDKDKSTGARNATEVGSSSDVVVGG